jgi:RNA polymerase sigma factor (sigma-70 family)
MISQKLISQLIEKDHRAFEEFYLQTVDIFYRFVKTQYNLPEDDIQQLLSEYYIKIWDHMSDYKTSYKFETRYRTIFRNMLKDRFKKLKEYHFADLQYQNEEGQDMTFADTLESDDEDILSVLDRDFKYTQITDAISHLTPEYAEVLYLRYVEQKTNEEIASLCDVSVDNVRQRISRWLKKVKELLA